MTLYLPDAVAISDELQRRHVDGVEIHVFETLESTSGWLREQIFAPDRGNANVHLCITDSQIAGIGRRGKSWQTRPGNMTFSVRSLIARQPQELLGLSLVTGIGVASALRDALSLCVELKWPNDVILQDAKLGGLLTEIVARGNVDQQESPVEVSEIITGVGINVLGDPAVSLLGIGATSLEEAGVNLPRGNRDRLVGTIAASILHSHHQFEQEGWAPFENHWKQFDWLSDKPVSIHRESLTEHAVARGVNHQGALLVEREGELSPLYGGNVSIRPKV